MFFIHTTPAGSCVNQGYFILALNFYRNSSCRVAIYPNIQYLFIRFIPTDFPLGLIVIALQFEHSLPPVQILWSLVQNRWEAQPAHHIFRINWGCCIILRISNCNISRGRLIFRFTPHHQRFWLGSLLRACGYSRRWRLRFGPFSRPPYLCFPRHIGWWRGNCQRNGWSRCYFSGGGRNIAFPPPALGLGLLAYPIVV